jgi:carbon-monoxide dehydrogenase medium subunit
MHMKDGVIDSVRIALTNVGPTALRASGAENALLGKPLDDTSIAAAVAAARAICDPQDDLRGDIAYKTAMAGQMLRRALLKAASRCH